MLKNLKQSVSPFFSGTFTSSARMLPEMEAMAISSLSVGRGAPWIWDFRISHGI
jgi:hypothetical protein